MAVDTATYLAYLKFYNAKAKTAGDATTLAQQIAGRNEIQNDIRWLGGDPSLWDFPQGTVIMNAGTTAVPSSTFTVPHEFMRCGAILRIAATGGTAATYTIQGDVSSGFTSPTALQYADSGTPATFGTANIVLAAPATKICLIREGQMFKYIRVNVTAVTGMTSTIDITYFGG